MFRFEEPAILYLLILVAPLLACFYIYLYRKHRNIRKLGDQNLILSLMPDYSKGKNNLKFYCILCAFILLIFTLANPQMGTKVKKVDRKGIDLMIALDISESMNCQDIQPSRLMRSKQSIIRLLEKLQNDRIGLVVFAGDAFVQLPLTSDYGAAKLFINNINTSDMSVQGTAIGAAIDLCTQSFDPQSANKKNKAIIVISDGENHEDNAMDAAAKASSNNIIVNTIGMGLPQGGPIPIYVNGQIQGYKRDKEDHIILTKLNENMLQEIAQAGNGSYVSANNSSAGVETIFEKLNKLDKTTHDSRNISDYESKFQYILFGALLLLIIDLLLFEKKNKIFNYQHLFGVKRP
ncbi:MAG: VWA domain-containing protein [Bacteroidales bacterium]